MNKRKQLNTTQIIAIGFLSAILIGALLLALPISHAGEPIAFVDALFTSVTSICVTGLTTVTVGEAFSLFGEAVILLLIQVGGFGIITITSGMWMLLRKRFTVSDSLLLADALNLDSLSGLSAFLSRVFKYTFVIEGICFLCYLPTFLPQYGVRGVWISLFHSVSAFCNAGIDLLGSTSLIAYRGDLWLNLVTMTEIILGGIGFVVFFELSAFFRDWWHAKKTESVFHLRLSLHAKTVLLMTAFLIVFGMLGILLFEWSNPQSLGSLPIGKKLLAALFQSVTCRTAGFATISQAGLTGGGAVVCCLLMFIGGSPIGTAGGIKTTTAVLLILSTVATLRGEHEIHLFRRTVPIETVKKATAVGMVAILAVFAAALALMLLSGADGPDAFYEVISALATVGLTRDLTGTLNLASKWLVMVCMFFGRIGPTSLVILISGKKPPHAIRYAKGNMTVG